MKIIKQITFGLLTLLLAFSCSDKYKWEKTEIVCGNATIMGKLTITNGIPEGAKLNIGIMSPITNGIYTYSVAIDKDGRFWQEVETELRQAVAGVWFSNNPYQTFMIPVIKDEVTEFEVIFDQNGEVLNIELEPKGLLSKEDVQYGYNILNNDFLLTIGDPSVSLSKDTPMEYAKAVEDQIDSHFQQIQAKMDKLTPFVQTIDKMDGKLIISNLNLFSYGEDIDTIDVTETTNNDHEKQKPSIPIEYYSFLNMLNLQTPTYLYCTMTPELFEDILTNKVLDIEPIEEQSIDEWQQEAKSILVPLIGTDSQEFFDVLTTNAYSLQIRNKGANLSETQLKNINDYFGGNEYQKILERFNGK